MKLSTQNTFKIITCDTFNVQFNKFHIFLFIILYKLLPFQKSAFKIVEILTATLDSAESNHEQKQQK